MGRSLSRALKELKDLQQFEYEEKDENEPIEAEWIEEPDLEDNHLEEVGVWLTESIEEMDSLNEDRKQLTDILDNGADILDGRERSFKTYEELQAMAPESLTNSQKMRLDWAKKDLWNSEERLRTMIESLDRIRKSRNFETKPIRYEPLLQEAMEYACEVLENKQEEESAQA